MNLPTSAVHLPSLFLSHGSPMLALEDSPTGRFLDRLGGGLPLPRAHVRVLADAPGGVRIVGLQMSQPSLDDVFLKYTGRHIRTEAADNYIPLGW